MVSGTRSCRRSGLKQVADETGGETELVLIKDGIHGVHHVAHIERPKMADWLAAKLS